VCFLADVYLEQARATDTSTHEGQAERRRLTDEASNYYYQAARIDGGQMLPHLGLGNVALLMGNMRAAKQEFELAVKSRNGRQKSVAGTLALARLEFAEKRYEESLALYQKALRECPECPAEVRGAIGACQYCLGNVSKAKQAFARALELNPGCVVASIGMGVIEMVDGGAKSVGEKRTAKKYPTGLFRAFKLDASHPYSALLMSEYAMGQSMYDEALAFANLARARLPGDDVQAKAQLVSTIGRLHHARGEMDKAIECYRQAIDLDKVGCRSARLALAQALTSKRDLTQATGMFQQLMREYPAWVDIARYFGPLIPHLKGGQLKNKELLKEFARMVEEVNVDPRLWEVLGDVVCLEDPARALKSYSRAIELFSCTDSDASTSNDAGTENGEGARGGPAAKKTMDYTKAPCRLLNNAAVLYLRTGQAATAFTLLSAAMESVKSGKLGNLHPLSQVTLGYNIARTTEAMGDDQSAEKEYMALLKEFPKYVDCQLRLACICKKRGDIKGAERWAREAAEASSNSADALGLLAGIHIDRRDLGSAKKCVDELLTALPADAKGVEVYGRLALGNIHLYSIPGDLHQDGNYEKAVSNLTHAMGLYRRALEKDPGNLFAANGIGCVLAESGRLSEAKDVFLRVQEAASASDGFVTVSDASVNLAGVLLGLQQPKAAEATFLQACKKNRNLQLDPRLLLYLAKAQYESDQVDHAIKTVAKALHIAPGDHRLRFNAAYLMQQAGAKVLQQSEFAGGDDGKVMAFEGAALSFENSHRIFLSLQELGQATTGIAARKLQHHVAFAAEMHGNALEMIKKAELKAQQADARRQEMAIRKAAADKARELDAMKKAAEEDAERRRREEIAKAAEEMHARSKEAYKMEKKRQKAIAKGDVSGIPDKKAKETQAAQAEADMDALFGSDSEDDEYKPGDEQQDAAPPDPAAPPDLDDGEEEYVESDVESDDDGAPPKVKETKNAKEAKSAAKKATAKDRRARKSPSKAAKKRKGDDDAVGAVEDPAEQVETKKSKKTIESDDSDDE
jgi:RNA polymerase-associated protein CTR9